MPLSKMKLSGFKSFVDPTTLTLPSHLVAIVGPNGCGKSNIIDAITWVLGESSPKYLRGESSTDVIFNGSHARKPVGQASVELVFDNLDGKMGGEYASFSEVAIKRVINRDADSVYYLNGVRCRKRDVVDLFLGTGLGPRSYSIIGQNMVGKMIEAKPEELRTYLEEAAGISKYKERRHETALRIDHTKENIARINDVRVELEKQLNHLKQQANTAEKFKILKQQERTLQAEVYCIQWRILDTRLVGDTLQIQREETALEARQSEISTTDKDIEQLRHEQHTAQEAFQEVQRRYYAVGNEITRIEQDVLHHQERQQQWMADLKQVEQDWDSVKNQLDEAGEEIQTLEQEIQQIEPAWTTGQTEVAEAQQVLITSDEALQSWQSHWDHFNQVSAASAQMAQVEKTRIQHLEQKIAALQKRQDQLQQDQKRLDLHQLHLEIEELGQQSESIKTQAAQIEQQRDTLHQEMNTLQAEQQECNLHLDKTRNELQKLRGQQASLETLQQTALGQRNHPIASWMKQHALSDKPRLAQGIDVESGWEWAVERTLGFCLQAICVDEMNQVLSHLDSFKAGNLCVLSAMPTKEEHSTQTTKGTLLSTKVKSSWPLHTLMTGIYAADSMEEALVLCESLAEHESVVTRDGVWMNKAWVKILRQDDPALGVLQREKELKKLVARIRELEILQNELDNQLIACREKIKKHEQERDRLHQSYTQYQTQIIQMHAQRKAKEERLSDIHVQAKRAQQENDECLMQRHHAEEELEKARELWQQALTDLEMQAQQKEGLLTERDQLRQQTQTARDIANKKREKIHTLEIRLQTAKSQKSTLQQQIIRLQTQLAALNERKIVIQSELNSMSPIDHLKKSLSRALDKHVSIEAELNHARVGIESLDQESRNLEERRQAIEKELNHVRNKLETLRVEWQGWKIKSDTLLEQLQATELTLEEVLKGLPQNISLDEWQAKLNQVIQRINRLGPINLVAIDEYAVCLERKQYIDKQLEDLQTGLATLEEAIAKIDKESRARFKETFDTVNQQFQTLFPRIFGGGKAYLELTSEDLLEAGVTMMACPPGKRNSSIYLLSGGEKTLVAIALIFSIFYLNPAPFCLLDEVDAALDDANVLRFSRLLKTMAEKTQFIFISHNKITIEIAEHLIGVTMNEPGVSRLVSVDIEKAMSLVES